MNQRYGILLVVSSAVAFGLTPLFALSAFNSGVNLTTLLFLRFTIAAVAFWGLTLWSHQSVPHRPRLTGLIAMGAGGFMMQSLCYFSALTRLNAGLVALLLYLYPAIVAVLAVSRKQEHFRPRLGFAILLSLVGIALIADARLETNWEGIGLALSAAIVNAVYVIHTPRLFLNNVFACCAVAFTSAASIFLLLIAVTPVSLQLPHTLLGWMASLAIGILSTFALSALLIGVKLLNATRAALLSTLEPVVTMILAVTLLEQPLTLTQVGGSLLILGSAALTSQSSR